MLTGEFYDAASDVEMSLNWDQATKELSADSCVFIPELGVAAKGRKQLQFRTADNGYGIFWIRGKMYMRIAYSTESGGRALMADVLNRRDNRWQPLTRFVLEEMNKDTQPNFKFRCPHRSLGIE